MHYIAFLVANELRYNAVRLFIDADAQYEEMLGNINYEVPVFDAECTVEQIRTWEVGMHVAQQRGQEHHDKVQNLREVLRRRYENEVYRQSQGNRSKMTNPTNTYRTQHLPRNSIEARAAVGREAGKLIATIVKLAPIDPTADMKNVRLLNDTMTRMVELMGESTYAVHIANTARDRVQQRYGRGENLLAHVENMLTFLDAVRAAWYNWEAQAQPAHRRRRPVWHQSLWYRAAKAHRTLCPYVAAKSDTLGGIAVAETYARLYAERFTVMKPGRYLLRYFGDVLTEYDIKAWAQKQIGDSGDAAVYFAKTADEIVWAYENSPRSCMKMNRDERYIAEGLDEDTHPVRAYAHPENHLAVAFIMGDKTAKPDYGSDYNGDYYPPVAARTVVNMEKQCYYRLYGRNGMESALESALNDLGYVYRADTLAGELLSLQRVDDYLNDDSDDEDERYESLRNGWTYAAVPYVDGGYCHAVYERTPEGREQLRIMASDHGWVRGLNPVVIQNSTGVVPVDTRKNWYGVETLLGETHI